MDKVLVQVLQSYATDIFESCKYVKRLNPNFLLAIDSVCRDCDEF